MRNLGGFAWRSLLHRAKPAIRAVSVLILVAVAFAAPLCAPLLAQQAEAETYAGFEGEMVSKVEISVGPGVHVDTIRGLLKIKPGEPFSAAALRATVQALQQTKSFSKVQATMEPGPSGLSVLFTLDPTSYVGVISFPGAENFAYTRLLQTVNIPEQSPYFDDLLPQGQKALEQFLKLEGYFRARVSSETQRDDPHRIVNLVFRAQLGPRAKVGNIEIAGVSPAESARIRQSLHSIWARVKRDSLKSGQTYSQERMGKVLDYIRAYLRGENRLAPVVRLASADYNPQSNRADLTFEVNPGPLVSIKITGAHLWQRTLRHEIPVYEEGSADQDLVEEGERNLVSYFQSKGYFDVKINTVYHEQPNAVSIEYQVDRGSRHRVEGVYFDGNKYFSDVTLGSVASVKKGHSIFTYTFSRGKFSNDLVRKTVDAITALYTAAGFANVKVAAQVADFDPQVDVSFQITEGSQNKVNTLLLEGNTSQPRRVLSGNGVLNLQPGKPYSPHLLDLDRNRILASYLNLGYLSADLKATATPEPGDPHLFDVVYRVEEGPQGHVNDVVTLGETVTRPSLIRLVTRPNVAPGQPLSEGKLFTAESDLYNLNIFDWVSVKPLAPVSDESEAEVLVKVHESKRYSVDVGGGIEVIPRSGNIPVGDVALPGLPPIGLGTKFTVSQKSFFGPRFSFALSKHDIRGHAESATISTVLSRLDQSGSFTYSDPRFRDTKWSSLFSLSGQRSTDNPLYTADLGTASFQLERFLDARRAKNLILRYSFQRIDLGNVLIPDLVLPQDRKVRVSTVAAEYVRDGRDDPLDAHHGIYQVFDFGVTPTVFGSSANFLRFLGQNAVYVPLRPWLTWATNVRLGLAAPFAGSVVPLSQRFFSGGADSLRGFPINGAGPQRPVNVCSNPSNPATCTLISVPVGGNMLFILNTEARLPAKILRNLGVVFFYDGGNVYSNINFRQFVDDYTHSVGIGLRYRTPVGPVRFDVGYRLSSVPGVNATQYFVTLGQSF